MKQSDLAKKQYWDEVYGALSDTNGADWSPRGYEERVLGHELARVLRHSRPTSALEVGCGDSPWLPYLAREYHLEVAGIDYSERGCELARHRLQQASTRGTVYCRDLFTLSPEETGTFDLVFSLGVVEHFADLNNVLSRLLRFVRPGGVLFTSVPNLRSLHGLGMWIYQPEVLAKHRVITREELAHTYQRLGLRDIRTGHAGFASVGIVSRGVQPRFRQLDGLVVPLAQGANILFQMVMKHLPVSGGLPWLAPFIVASGVKNDPGVPASQENVRQGRDGS